LHAVPILTFVDVLAVFFVFGLDCVADHLFCGSELGKGKDERVGGSRAAKTDVEFEPFFGRYS
jgi:hypothetical protein